jgi:ABC-2 type transport system permease protein
MPFLRTLFQSRFWALTLKEIQQILRNKQIIFLLLFPPLSNCWCLGWP